MDGSESSVSFGDQDRSDDMATSGRQGSVEIPESPCRDGHRNGLHARLKATVTTGPQSKTDYDRSRLSGTRQQWPLQFVPHVSKKCRTGRKGRHVSQRAEASPYNRSMADDEIWGSASDTSCLGVFGQRETSRGPEYHCLPGTWLRPEDGIAKKHIQEYHDRLVQRSRWWPLRKRKRESDPKTNKQMLQKIKCWKDTLG